MSYRSGVDPLYTAAMWAVSIMLSVIGVLAVYAFAGSPDDSSDVPPTTTTVVLSGD